LAKLVARLPGWPCGAQLAFEVEFVVSESLHPSAPNHMPRFVTASGDIDMPLMVIGIVHAMLDIVFLTMQFLKGERHASEIWTSS
jgi:hypothetical protein